MFLSDRRAVQASDVAAMLWEDGRGDDEADEDDEDEGTRPVAEPVGDAALLADLGTPAAELLDAVRGGGPAARPTCSPRSCERAGCADVLEQLREG